MAQLFADNVKSTLSVQLLSNATSLRVADFAKFPVLTTGDFFKLVITMGLDYEIVKVVGSDSAQSLFYIERAQDGSTAKTWPAGETTVFIGPVAADAALAARWESGYPIYNVPLNGQLKKFHCNVLTSGTSTYTWPSNPVLGDALEIINHTSSTAVRTINNTFTLDIRTLGPIKLLCENLSSWVFRATKLTELIGLQYANLNDRPASLLPNKPNTDVSNGVLFVYPDNQSLRLTGTGSYTLYPPVNSGGRAAKSVIIYVNGTGGSITDSTSGRVITINQRMPNGFLLTANADGSWDIPFIRTSDYASYSPIENFPQIPHLDGEVVPGVEYQLRQQDNTNWGSFWPSSADVEEAIDPSAPGWTQYFLRFKRVSDYNALVVKQDFFEVTLLRDGVTTTNSYTRVWLESTSTWQTWVKTNVTWKTFEQLYTFIADMALTFMTKDNPVGKGVMILEGPDTPGYAGIQLQHSSVGPVANISGVNGGLSITGGSGNNLMLVDNNGVQAAGQITFGSLRQRMGQRAVASLNSTSANWVTLINVPLTNTPWSIEGFISVPSHHFLARVRFSGTTSSGGVGPTAEVEILGSWAYTLFYPAAWRIRNGPANTSVGLDFRFLGSTSGGPATVHFDVTSAFIGDNPYPLFTFPLAWAGAGSTTGSAIFQQIASGGTLNFIAFKHPMGATAATIQNTNGTMGTLAPVTTGGVGPT